jgi:O-antigen/teichoic acid export membrane protein
MTISRRLVISNAVYQGAGSLLIQLVNFFILPLFVRNMGAELYGIWTISFLLIGYFDFFDLGLFSGLQRYVAKAHVKNDIRDLSVTVSSSFFILMGMAVIMGTLILCLNECLLSFFRVGEAIRDDARMLLLVTGVAAFFIWPMKVGDSVLQGTLHIQQASVINTLGGIASSFAMLGMILARCDVVAIRVAVIVITLLSRMAVWVQIWRYFPGVRLTPRLFQWSKIKEMMSFSLGMLVANLIFFLGEKIQPLILGRMLGAGSITSFTILSKAFATIRQYTSMINQTITVTTFNLAAAKDVRRIEMMLDKAVKYRAVLTLPLAIIGILVMPDFLKLWVGIEYAGYAVWAQLLMLVILGSPLAAAHHIAKGCGYIRQVNYVYGLRVLVTLTVTLLTIPKFGVGGAVIGLLASQTVTGDIAVFPYCAKVIGIPGWHIFRSFFVMLGVNLLVGLAGFFGLCFVNIETWPRLIGFGGVMAAALYTINFLCFFTKDEKHDIVTLLSVLGLKCRRSVV